MPTTTPTRSTVRRTAAPRARRSPPDWRAHPGLLGLLAAAWAWLLGLIGTAVVVLAGWVAADHSQSGPADAFRAALRVWLAAHHGVATVAGSPVGLLPLGLLALPVALLVPAGRWVARTADLRDPRAAARAVTALVLGYGGLAGALAPLASAGSVVVPPAPVALGAAVLAMLAGGGAVLVASGTAPWRRLPLEARGVAAAAAAGVATLVAGGAALVLLALAGSAASVSDVASALHPGAVGGALLAALLAVYLPNAVVWAIGLAAGPGFAVGVGTSVSPHGTHLGRVPLVPLLAALPPPGPAPRALLLVLLLPTVAGVVVGLVAVRRVPTWSAEAAAAVALAAGATTGVAVGALAALSGGPLGSDLLAAVGPSGWQVGLAVALEVGVVGGTTAWLRHWWAARRPAGR